MSECITALQAATQGLLYPSETDAPLEVHCWAAPAAAPRGAAQLCALVGEPAGQPVQLLTLDGFFAPVATPREWHNEEERAEVARFQHLRELLEGNLQGPCAFRVGGGEATLYVVGRCGEGWAGLVTHSVET